MYWVKLQDMESYGESLFVGKWRVGGIAYDCKQTGVRKWQVVSALPSDRRALGHFTHLADARRVLEAHTKAWIDGLELAPTAPAKRVIRVRQVKVEND